MEGDAGAGRLNHTDQAGTEDSAAALPDTNAEDVSGAGDVPDPQPAADDGYPAAVDEHPDVAAADVAAASAAVAADQGPSRGPSRLRRGGVLGVCAALVLVAAGVATGGYFALRSHQQNETVDRDNAEAIAAAEDCVAATQAPNIAALPAAQRKIIECGTGNFAAQAAVYGGMLMQAYQAADVHVQVSEMRTAVERNNDDGSVDLLVALRVKVDNIEAQGQEYGYRLRVQMARDDGQFKIARLDQVAK